MSPDAINGCFELFGGIAVLFSVHAILKDKCHAGISRINLLFFNSWSLWNIFYYPSLGQHWSFLGGCFIVMCNLIYLFCVWYFPHAKTTPHDT